MKSQLETNKDANITAAELMSKAIINALEKTTLLDEPSRKIIKQNTEALKGLTGGISLKTDNNINIRLSGAEMGSILQGMRRETAELVRNSIVEAFGAAKIDDNGRITLDETRSVQPRFDATFIP